MSSSEKSLVTLELPAVLENYERVQEYRNMQDYLYEHYLCN